MADADAQPARSRRHAAIDEDETDEDKPTGAQLPAWVARLGRAVVDRLPAMGVAICAGLLLCVSFPPFGWWYTAVVAFAVLGWVLLRESTTPVGGFGYGFLFGLAFYIPLLPWTGELVGAIPWLGLSAMSALFPGLFGIAAVAVRRLGGWPIWFAALWVVSEWLKCAPSRLVDSLGV